MIIEQVAEALNRKVEGIAVAEHFLNAVFVNGIVFGMANETWGGDDAETGEVYATSVPNDCNDPEVIAEAILKALAEKVTN